MTFIDIEFWFLLIPTILIFYFYDSLKFKQVFLLFISYLIYGIHAWYYLPILLFSTYIDYAVALKLEKNRTKTLLFISMTLNLSLLFIFKYYNFFSEDVMNSIFSMDMPLHNLLLPLGISFYTFQTMSYTIDVYKGKINAEKSFLTYALYVSFFAQLVAGPIERAAKLIPQLKALVLPRVEMFMQGLMLIAWGLFLKLVIADNLSKIVNSSYSNNVIGDIYVYVFISLLALIKVYTDFMAYSEIARGIGKLFGIELSLNFRNPFFAKSITHFWERWHITLTNWLSDYVFKNLLKKGMSKLRIKFSVIITLTLIGLWHGATWSFVIFGLYHGIGIVLYKLVEKSKYFKTINKYTIFSRVYLFVLLLLGMPLFMNYDIENLINIYLGIFNSVYFNVGNFTILSGKLDFLLAFLGLIILFIKEIYEVNKKVDFFSLKLKITNSFLFIFFMLIAIILFGNNHVENFIYFEF